MPLLHPGGCVLPYPGRTGWRDRGRGEPRAAWAAYRAAVVASRSIHQCRSACRDVHRWEYVDIASNAAPNRLTGQR